MADPNPQGECRKPRWQGQWWERAVFSTQSLVEEQGGGLTHFTDEEIEAQRG